MKNLKKVISSAAAVAMLASSASAFAVTFPDVDESASYANAVSTLTALGVVNGDDNGKFNPENTVTRAEFAKMVVEAIGEGEAAASSSYTKFADSKSHWGAGYIETGVSKGFINGYDDDTFGPDDTVTYAQAVKMLVAACGYDLYASQQGGWPSGYLAYGSSLDIINGVTGVTNDTALTRAQCAVLIANAMKASNCVIEGYNAGGLTGTVLTPNYVEKNGTGKGWQSMLTRYHNAYVVKGRVIETAKEGTLDNGEVKFTIEAADNFDDTYITKNNTTTLTMLAGDTNADELLFTYAEAIVAEDEDTGDYTIVSITPYGKSEIVEAEADDDVIYDSTNNRVEVPKSENTTATNKYELEDNAVLYVNGVKVAALDAKNLATSKAAFAKAFKDYVTDAKLANFKLIDSTETASTSTNGKYDYIMVTYYQNFVVSGTQTTSEKARVNTYAGGRIEWYLDDVEEGKVDVKFTLEGAEIDYTDLEEYDVLTVVANDVDNIKNATSINAIVTRNVVTGSVTSFTSSDDKIVVDGSEYKVISGSKVDKTWLGTEYTLYLDAFGNVAYNEVGTSSKKYAIYAGSYYSNAEGNSVVRLITFDGEVVTYVAKTDEDARNFAKLGDSTIVTEKDVQTAGSGTATAINGISVAAKTVAPKSNEMVVEYKLSSGKIQFVKSVAAVNGTSKTQEYKESTSKLGKYEISDASTKVLDLEEYMSTGDTADVAAFDAANFVDEVDYDVYVFDKNTSNVYNFVIIARGVNALNADSDLAVVTKMGGTSEIDDEEVTEVTVAMNGEEDITVYFEGSVDFAEGTIIAYKVGSNGYVKDDTKKISGVDTPIYYDVIYAPKSAYTKLFDYTVDPTTGKVSASNTTVPDMVAEGMLTIVDKSDSDVLYAFGPLYNRSSSSITIFNNATGVVSDVNLDVEDYSLTGANTYVYNYSATKNKGVSVEVGSTASWTSKDFTATVFDDDDKSELNWNKFADEGINLVYAWVRTVDGDTTDVVFYVAE